MDAVRRVVVALALLVTACAPALRVRTDFQRGTDFGQFHTFRMAEVDSRQLDGDPSSDELEKTNVKDRVDRALRARLGAAGLAPAGPGTADLIVKYAASVRTLVKIERAGYPYTNYGPQSPSAQITYPGNYWVQSYPEGTLEIELVDARTDRLVWRATCSAIGAHIDEPGFIEKAIAKAFRDYPPRAS